MTTKNAIASLLEQLASLREAGRGAEGGEVSLETDDEELRALTREVNALLEAARRAKDVHRILDSIVSNVPIMLFVKDATELRMQLWNQAGEALLGISAAEMLGKTDHDFFPPEQANFFQQKDREVLSGKALVAVEEPITTRKGDRWLYTKKVPLLDESGVPRYLLGISEDITERRQRAEELRLAKEAAEAANRAKGEFLANLSHELRTPLTLILGTLEQLLADEGALAGDASRKLGRARRSAVRLRELVNDLLDFSKAEAGRLQLHWEAVPIVERAAHLVEDAQSIAHARGLTLHMETGEDPGLIPLDGRMLDKILMNLVGNALKFTPTGGRIKVWVGACGDEVEVSVEDTGIGIAHDKVQSLFQRFHQIDSSASRRFEGTGLGLALVKEIVDAVGGRIAVESEPGRGSCFRVRFRRTIEGHSLPTEPPEPPSVARRERVEARLPEASGEAAHAARDPGKPLLLVADDNADMRAHLVDLLADEYDVIAVGNGRDLLRAADQEAPLAILSDVMMPELDGFELTRRLRANPVTRRIPIILLTAQIGEQAAVAGLEAGADDYLSKPFSRAELKARLRAAIRAYSLELTTDELRESRDIVVASERASAKRDVARGVAAALSPLLETLRHRGTAAGDDAATRAALAAMGELVARLAAGSPPDERATPE